MSRKNEGPGRMDDSRNHWPPSIRKNLALTIIHANKPRARHRPKNIAPPRARRPLPRPRASWWRPGRPFVRCDVAPPRHRFVLAELDESLAARSGWIFREAGDSRSPRASPAWLPSCGRRGFMVVRDVG
jgi:hypothetical protein